MYKYICGLLLITILAAANLFAQIDSSEFESHDGTAKIVLTDALLFTPSAILFLGVHEIGHSSVASIFGGHDVRFGLIRTAPNGNHQLGWTDWSNDIGHTGKSFTFLSGVLFTRGLAEGSDLVVRDIPLPRWGQRFFSMTFLLGRFDFPRYVVMDALVNTFGRPGSDINFFVKEVAGQNSVSRVLVYGALLGLATVDLVLDWNRISTHWQILTGKTPIQSPLGYRQTLRIHPLLSSRYQGVCLQLSF